MGRTLPGYRLYCGGESEGISTEIVHILKLYSHEVPTGFIASKLGVSENDIDKYLRKLESKKVVKRRDGTVILTIRE